MKEWSLTTKVLVALVLGLIFGLVVLYPLNGNAFVADYIIGGILALVGKIFVNSIKMMVVPLVLISITVGAASIGDIKKLGRIGTKTVLFLSSNNCNRNHYCNYIGNCY